MLITTNLTVSPNMKMAYSNQTTTITITAGNLENVTITPPTGYLMEINGLTLSAPAVGGLVEHITLD
jgi:hypothetical protein